MDILSKLFLLYLLYEGEEILPVILKPAGLGIQPVVDFGHLDYKLDPRPSVEDDKRTLSLDFLLSEGEDAVVFAEANYKCGVGVHPARVFHNSVGNFSKFPNPTTKLIDPESSSG